MEITLEALNLGKPTVINDKEYFATKEYVSDFIKEAKKFTNKFIVQVEIPNQVTLSNSSKDITYNKVWIQAIMPDQFNVSGYNEVISLAYALDVKTPVYKVYRAYLNPKTKNTIVFNPTWVQTGTIKPEEKFVFSISNLMEMESDFENKLDELKGTYISSEIKDIHELLGRFIDRVLVYDYNSLCGKVKLSPNDIIKAYKNTFNSINESPNLLCFYEEICSQINTNKDIINRFEKTLLISMLFDLVENEDSN